MHVIFLNPQGNFDPADAHLTEHPDFGGQLIYVKEICMSMAKMGIKVDIVTRRIEDPDWPEFSAPLDSYPGFEDNLRIVRIDCGGKAFVCKEQLWEHMDEFINNTLAFYGDELPDFATGHYGDGGYCAALLKNKAGIGYTLTGHSLGAQKLDKMGMNLDNFAEMEEHYHFSKRIHAERVSMEQAYNIITSTDQERFEQYSHLLYQPAVNVDDNAKFSVIPPGVNTDTFTTDAGPEEEAIYRAMAEQYPQSKPAIIMASRFEEKKNHIGVVAAYVHSKKLQDKADLVIFIRSINDPYTGIEELPEDTQRVLQPILDMILEADLKKRVHFIKIESQLALAATYRYYAQLGSVFALAAFYEPFGLAPIEAAACGLAEVATQNGGPSDIFEKGEGVLIDPTDENSIKMGLLKGLNEEETLSRLGQQLVEEKYTWDKTAEAYLEVIRQGAAQVHQNEFPLPDLNDNSLLHDYLEQKA